MWHRLGRRGRPSLLEVGRELGWEPTDLDQAFLRDLETALTRPAAPARVAVLAPPGDDRLSQAIARFQPQATVTRVDVTLPPFDAHVVLAAAGRFDVVVDDGGAGTDRVELFRRCFPHLSPQGSYLARGLRSVAGGSGDLVGLVAELVAPAPDGTGAAPGQDAQDHLALAQMIEAVRVEDDHLVAGCRSRAWAKLPETEVDRFLELRGGSSGRVATRLPPVVFASRGTLRQSPSFRDGTSSRQPPFADTFDVPAVALREYRDVVCLKRQVALHDNVLLPDTYRKNHRWRLRNHRVHDVGAAFGVPAGRPGEARGVDGPLFYLDSEYRGHFGHAMTEQLSRLWAWQEAKQREPELRALLLSTVLDPAVKAFERALYAAAGVAPEDLVLLDGPVTVDRLYAATPMFTQPYYVHPDLRALWDRVSGALAQEAPRRDLPSRLFCARRGSERACRNPDDVEGLFTARGFEVIYPEDFTLPEQVAMFRRADVIAGYAGSALFNIALTGSPKRVVMVAPDSYIARNEHLMASAMGHALDVVWSASEVAMPQGSFSRAAFTSGFTFDPNREGRYLADLLDGL